MRRLLLGFAILVLFGQTTPAFTQSSEPITTPASTAVPSVEPTISATSEPDTTSEPTSSPTILPSIMPSPVQSSFPSVNVTAKPSATIVPTATIAPTASPFKTGQPASPTQTAKPNSTETPKENNNLHAVGGLTIDISPSPAVLIPQLNNSSPSLKRNSTSKQNVLDDISENAMNTLLETPLSVFIPKNPRDVYINHGLSASSTNLLLSLSFIITMIGFSVLYSSAMSKTFNYLGAWAMRLTSKAGIIFGKQDLKKTKKPVRKKLKVSKSI